MEAARFIGTWSLVSFEIQRPNGETIYPSGRDAQGILMYDANGKMSVRVSRRDRGTFASGDRQVGTEAEIQAAYLGYIGYYGAYQVNEPEGTVAHHVEGSLFPNWEGQIQKRYFKLSDHRLTLTTPPTPFGGERITAVLVWARVT